MLREMTEGSIVLINKRNESLQPVTDIGTALS